MKKSQSKTLNQYVIIRDMSFGDGSAIEVWQETKIFPGNATLDEVMLWANRIEPCPNLNNSEQYDFSRRRITITKPDSR